MHLFHRLRRIGQIIAEFALKFLLIVRIPQHIFAVVQNLGVRIEEHAVELALPGIKSLHGRQELIRVPVGIFRIFEERRYLDNSRLVRGKKISVKPCGGLVGVVLTGPLKSAKISWWSVSIGTLVTLTWAPVSSSHLGA